MKFEQVLHWYDGQFLQPHHFQYFQRQQLEYLKHAHFFSQVYPWGLLDFELDTDALAGGRVVVKRFAAIMKDGTPLSMPGNCILSPLDINPFLEKNLSEITVYAALPLWSEFQANMNETSNAVKNRRFTPQIKHIRDENAGDNEISLTTRSLNVQLTTDLNDNKDMVLLPVTKLSVLSNDKAHRTLAMIPNFFPPYVVLTLDSPVSQMINGLVADIRRCRNKALNDLTSLNFKNEKLEDNNTYATFRLKSLNVYEQRLSSLLATGNIAPFDMYLELSTMLVELMAYDPVNSVWEVQRYNHDDSAPQFIEIIKDIRSFLLREGGADYIKLDFKNLDEERYLYTQAKPEDIYRATDAYLALKCGGVKDDVVKTVEGGDAFKLINPQAKRQRLRGVKLTETPYPPRYLPVMAKTLWFKLDLEDSARVWREITEEQGMVVDYVPEMFPALELSLYLTMGNTK